MVTWYQQSVRAWQGLSDSQIAARSKTFVFDGLISDSGFGSIKTEHSFFQTLFWFPSDLRKYFHWSRGGISLVKSLKSSPGRTKRGSCHFYSSAHKTGSTCFSWKHLNEMKTKNSAADNTKHVFAETFKVDDLYLSSFVRYCQFNSLPTKQAHTSAKNQIFNLKCFELSTHHLFC